MFHRLIKPSETNSYFIFGARGTGKTTWLQEQFRSVPHLWIDLMDPEEEEKFLLNPGTLKTRIKARPEGTRWIIIDEIQKAPKLLNLVHQHIEKDDLLFVLTGSSARKLKRGAANLLAGRAFVKNLHPLTHLEWPEDVELSSILAWGSLPKIMNLQSDSDKADYLHAYGQTYLAQEIIAEQLVRNLVPFRRFLQVAAQSNGKLINYSNIARDVGSDYKIVQTYFEILEETHVGFRLYPFESSFRKRLGQQPKFYFFDLGVARSMSRTLDVPLHPGTSAFGDAFEHLVVLEFYRLCSYKFPDAQLSFIQTKDGAEVDLVVEMPGRELALVEIKSTEDVHEQQLTTLKAFSGDLPQSKAFCLSRDEHRKQIGNVLCLPWKTGIQEILGLSFPRVSQFSI